MYRDLFELVPAAAAGQRPRLFCSNFVEAENLVRSGTLSLWDLRTDGPPRQPDQVCAIVPSLAGWITRHLRSPSGTPGTGHTNVETLLLQMADAELRSLRLRVRDLEQVAQMRAAQTPEEKEQLEVLVKGWPGTFTMARDPEAPDESPHMMYADSIYGLTRIEDVDPDLRGSGLDLVRKLDVANAELRDLRQRIDELHATAQAGRRG
jgi:hypothetical protein